MCERAEVNRCVRLRSIVKESVAASSCACRCRTVAWDSDKDVRRDSQARSWVSLNEWSAAMVEWAVSKRGSTVGSRG
jgi:hypothetical protein